MRGHVGQPYAAERLKELMIEAARRYEAKIPPGYLDEKKSGDNAAGDYLLWTQVLDYAHSERRPVVLITDDTKEDWFWRVPSGRTIGPRPELVAGLRARAAVPLLLYTPSQFMALVSATSETEIDPAVLEEAEARELARSRRPARAPGPPDPDGPLRLVPLTGEFTPGSEEIRFEVLVVPAGVPGRVECRVVDPVDDVFFWEGISPTSGIVTLLFPDDFRYMSESPDKPMSHGDYTAQWSVHSKPGVPHNDGPFHDDVGPTW